MIVIEAKFLNFSDVTVQVLHKAFGIYIIWEEGAQRYPKYIGQGKLLQRLAQSEARCENCWQGLICIMGIDGDDDAIEDAKIVENMLLYIGRELDRSPEDNKRIESRAILDALEEHNQIRINVKGRNPFLDPSRPMLNGTMQINVRPGDSATEVEVEHSFR